MSREINLLVVHCADTPASMDIGAAVINQWHLARGWSGIGYHDVILRDGSIERGRDLEEIGAHAAGHNENSIGVCLVGGKGGFNFTSAQMRSLNFYIDQMDSRYPGIEVLGHCDLPNVDKECPCFDVRAWRSIV
jgi:N-acetylmuramoyl-L-alanine amidase